MRRRPGDICYSHDGGASFELKRVGDTIESRPVWAGDRFISDGVTWTKLAASAAPGGHPIRSIVFGHGKPSAECPAP